MLPAPSATSVSMSAAPWLPAPLGSPWLAGTHEAAGARSTGGTGGGKHERNKRLQQRPARQAAHLRSQRAGLRGQAAQSQLACGVTADSSIPPFIL